MKKNYHKPKVLALVPARGGSKGIPRKNIKEFFGKPLISWTIEAALGSKVVDQIAVSSDDQEILDVSIRSGADITLTRPDEISQDDSTRNQVLAHALNEIKNFDYVIVLQPTSPLRCSQDIDKAFELLIKNSASACVSVALHHPPPEWTYSLNQKNELMPLPGFSFKSLRQQIPQYYSLNGAIYTMKVDEFLNSEEIDPFIGSSTIAYVMDRDSSIDIDYEIDWFIAEQIMRKKSDKI